MASPSFGEKILFWFIVGCISVFFAEVISGSTPYPFFTLAGWLIVFPVYLLHIIVLTTYVLRHGRPTIYTLYPAGMIFGMYEGYITKVLYGSAEWSHNGPSIGGIFLFPFFLVVLFWHPFMSFIIPLLVSEQSLTRSSTFIKYLPQNIVKKYTKKSKLRRNLYISATLLGLIGMFNLDPENAFLSGLSGLLFIIFLIRFWKWKYPTQHSFIEYLPGKRGFYLSLFLLGLIYVLFGAGYNTAYLMNGTVHLTTFFVYALLFLLFSRNLNISRREKPGKGVRISLKSKTAAVVIAIFVITTTLEAAMPFKLVIFAGFLVIEAVIGMVVLTHSVSVAMNRRIRFLAFLD